MGQVQTVSAVRCSDSCHLYRTCFHKANLDRSYVHSLLRDHLHFKRNGLYCNRRCRPGSCKCTDPQRSGKSGTDLIQKCPFTGCNIYHFCSYDAFAASFRQWQCQQSKGIYYRYDHLLYPWNHSLLTGSLLPVQRKLSNPKPGHLP